MGKIGFNAILILLRSRKAKNVSMLYLNLLITLKNINLIVCIHQKRIYFL